MSPNPNRQHAQKWYWAADADAANYLDELATTTNPGNRFRLLGHLTDAEITMAYCHNDAYSTHGRVRRPTIDAHTQAANVYRVLANVEYAIHTRTPLHQPGAGELTDTITGNPAAWNILNRMVNTPDLADRMALLQPLTAVIHPPHGNAYETLANIPAPGMVGWLTTAEAGTVPARATVRSGILYLACVLYVAATAGILWYLGYPDAALLIAAVTVVHAAGTLWNTTRSPRTNQATAPAPAPDQFKER